MVSVVELIDLQAKPNKRKKLEPRRILLVFITEFQHVSFNVLQKLTSLSRITKVYGLAQLNRSTIQTDRKSYHSL
jgi:hypothetical protein